LPIRARASSRAISRSLRSVSERRVVSLNSGIPDCFVPRISPGPRSLRSSSETSKPLFVFSRILSLVIASSPVFLVIRKQ